MYLHHRRDARGPGLTLALLLDDGAEPLEILIGRVLEIDGDMEVRHAEPADARRLVGQGLLVRMESEI
jgi:hypothetical protein